ncbi:MAG: hypothetical protein ABSE08_08935, partial [Syntrophobacteraceae bacterium]
PNLPDAAEECVSVSHSPHDRVLPAGAVALTSQMTHPGERLQFRTGQVRDAKGDKPHFLSVRKKVLTVSQKYIY